MNSFLATTTVKIALNMTPIARSAPSKLGILTACTLSMLLPGTWAQAGLPQVTDIAVETGFQDSFFGHFKRGRTCLAVDFDLDHRIDFFLGNPGDESFVIRNLGPDENGVVQFEAGEVLMDGEKSYGAAAADYDNDGDSDIFVTCGGIEGTGRCALFKNLYQETGALGFDDVTDAAGVRGAIPPGQTEPALDSYADCVWGDVDQDADVDIFVSVYIMNESFFGAGDHGDHDVAPRGPNNGRDVLWLNNGDGTFSDATDQVGLGASYNPGLHSTLLDIDNDGDLDLYENNWQDHNVLWQNQLSETGQLFFTDVTAQFSFPGEDLSYPYNSFVSGSADFNNDGWQDLVIFARDTSHGGTGPYSLGHAIFINQAGEGFVNEVEATGLNGEYVTYLGVMGCQMGDLNGDGIFDVYIGNGGVPAGKADQLWVSDASVSPYGTVPTWANITQVIDFPSPEDGTHFYPPYPYRTHACPMVDLDNDGVLEQAVVNGGHSDWPDIVREPNRLFEFDWGVPINYLKVLAVGDGVNVSRDAVGTRFALTLSEGEGAPWTIYNTLFAGSAFSAQNGFEVYFGLGLADTIHSLTVTWPNGKQETFVDGLATNNLNEIAFQCDGDANGDGYVDPLDVGFVMSRLGCTVGSGDAECDRSDQSADGSVDPLDMGYVLSRLGTCG